MHKYVTISLVLAITSLKLCEGQLGSIGNQTLITGCDLLPAYNILSCYSTANDSETALITALEQTSNWTEVHLILNNYAVDKLPPDIFIDTKLTYLAISVNCSSNGIPKDLLQSIYSPLSYLEFTLVTQILAINQADLSNLPFRHDLTTLTFQLSQLNTIEDGSFAELDQLKSLTIAQTSLNQLSSGLLQGLSNLQELSIVQSSISTLPQGLFASTPKLKNLWLGDNNFQTLANGTMDGLDQIQLVSVAGNPFYCDCALQWFKDWLINKALLETSGATCQYPVNATFQDVNFCPTN